MRKKKKAEKRERETRKSEEERGEEIAPLSPRCVASRGKKVCIQSSKTKEIIKGREEGRSKEIKGDTLPAISAQESSGKTLTTVQGNGGRKQRRTREVGERAKRFRVRKRRWKNRANARVGKNIALAEGRSSSL